MRLIDISIKRSAVMPGSFVMEIVVDTPMGEMKTTQYFDDFGGFLTAVQEAGTFFAVRLGRIKTGDANSRLLTKFIERNPEGPVR